MPPTLPDSHAWLAACAKAQQQAAARIVRAQVAAFHAQGTPAHSAALHALGIATVEEREAWTRWQLAREEIRENPMPFDPRERARVQPLAAEVLARGRQVQAAARLAIQATGPAKAEARAAMRLAEQAHAEACTDLRCLRAAIRAARPPRRLALPLDPTL